MTNLISITGEDSAFDRRPVHFFEAVCMWVDYYRDFTDEPGIAAKYGIGFNDASAILMELRHEGSRKVALAMLTEGFEAVHS